MKRLILASLLALVPAAAYPAAMTTWTLLSGSTRSVSASCAAGTSCDAPTGATEGILLAGVERIAVQVCAASGQTITDGAGLDFYWYDASGLWGIFNSTPYSVATGKRCAWIQGDSPGLGIPVLAGRGRLVVVPNAMTTSSGALTIYIYAVDAKGNLL